LHYRADIFQDSFIKFQGLTKDQLLGKLDVQFAGEEGIDAGGLRREYYYKLSQEMMNANYGLFKQSNLGSHTYQPNDNSIIQGNHLHLQYFTFCGRVVAKAIYDHELLDCHFTRAFYKQILGVPVSWRDMEAVDQDIYKGLLWILQNDITYVCLLRLSLDY
jgi:E3 ubiquitin-protein ligase HUWE1